MPDREKVIKGLEYHLKELSVGKTCFECPYCGDNPCEIQLIANTLALLKEQEAVRPRYIDGKRNHFIKCGKCNASLMSGMKYCPQCGRAVKW